MTTDVKKNFKASAELLEEVTKAYICDTFMEWAGLDDMDGKASKITIPHANTNLAKKKNSLWKVSLETLLTITFFKI